MTISLFIEVANNVILSSISTHELYGFRVEQLLCYLNYYNKTMWLEKEHNNKTGEYVSSHLCMSCPGPCGAVCIINCYSNLLNWPIVNLLFLFLFFSVCFVLIHYYTLCFTGFPCCKFSYYNYISIWHYYIVIHLCTHQHT